MLEKFKALSIFTGIFVSPFPLDDPAAFAEQFRAHNSAFDGEPIIRSLPPNSPPEMPRVICLSKAKTLIAEFAPAKINLRKIDTPVQRSLGDVYADFKPLLERMHAYLTEYIAIKITRLGCVCQLFVHLTQSANQIIGGYFLKPGLFDKAEEIHLSSLHKISLAPNLLVNRWVKVHPVRTLPPHQRDTGLMVEVDINTRAEQTYTFTTHEFLSFFDRSIDHIERQIDFLNDSSFLG
jgi:hypothetical protein